MDILMQIAYCGGVMLKILQHGKYARFKLCVHACQRYLWLILKV